MKFKDFALNEGSFEDMIADLSSDKKKGPGRWPVKDAPPEKASGTVTKTSPTSTVHRADKNYSGKGYSPKGDYSWRGVGPDPSLSLPSGGKQGGSYSSRNIRESPKTK